MKRILNFVVILLTTLSIVNAVNIPLRKRATAFAACPSGSPQFTAASIDPDPPVAGKAATAKISFTVPVNYQSGKFAVNAAPAGGGKSIDGFPTEQDVCTIGGITCPIAAGSTVEIETPVTIPDDAPDTYTLEYSIVDGTGKEIACSSGPVTGAAKAPGGDGGPGGKGPDDGGPGGPGGPGPGPDGGDGGDGKAPGGPGPGPDGGDGGDGGDGKAPAKGPKGPDGGPGGPAGKGKGGPGGPGGPDGGDGTPDDGGDGGPDGGGKAPPKGPDGPGGP